MSIEKAEAFEYEHIECPQSWVNAVLHQYQIFYWELVATQTIVSKESHLERGWLFDSDSIYSVTTTERFATIDLRRKRHIRDIDKIEEVEGRYFEICGELVDIGCSPVDNWAPPPEKSSFFTWGCLLYLLWIVPGIVYSILHSRKQKADNEKRQLVYQRLKAKLDSLLAANRQLLNV